MADVEFNRQTVIAVPKRNIKITTGIEMGSMVINEILTQSNPTYNEANSNSFEVRVFGIGDLTGDFIQVYQIIDDDETNPVYLFSGYVDSCKSDVFGHYRTIVAYDAFYIGKSVDVARYWNALSAETSADDTLRIVCSKVGIAVEQQSLNFISNLAVKLPSVVNFYIREHIVQTQDEDGNYISNVVASNKVESLSWTDFIIQYCQIFGVYANITREGTLEFIPFNKQGAFHFFTFNYRSGSYNTEIISKTPVVINDAPYSVRHELANSDIEGGNSEYQTYTVFPGFDYVSINNSSGNPIVKANDSWLEYDVIQKDGSVVRFNDRRGGDTNYGLNSGNIFLKYSIEYYEYMLASYKETSIYVLGNKALLQFAVDIIAQFYQQNKYHPQSSLPEYEINNKIDYIPMSLPLVVSNLNIQLGDYIVTERGNTFAMQITFSGSQLVNQKITAGGNQSENSVSAASFGGVTAQMQANAEQTRAVIETLAIKTTDKDCITNEMLIDGSIDFAKMNSAFIGHLMADDLFVKELKAEVAKIGALTVDDLAAETGDFSKLTANSAFVKQLGSEIGEFGYVKANYVESESTYSLFATIGEERVNLSLIRDAVIEEGHITGYLDAIKINADVIDAGTLSVDRLIVKGTDESILYKLNEGSITTETITKEDLENMLHGEHIIADTITARQINMSSLVGDNAFINALSSSVIAVTAQPYYTVTETPTLKNYPANTFYRFRQYKEGIKFGLPFGIKTFDGHIGSKAYDNNGHSWVFDKDSEGNFYWKDTSDSLETQLKNLTKTVGGVTLIDGGKIYTDEVFANKIFSEDITATGTITGANIIGGTIAGNDIAGGTINIGDGVFQVDKNGKVIASNMNITGGKFDLITDSKEESKIKLSFSLEEQGKATTSWVYEQSPLSSSYIYEVQKNGTRNNYITVSADEITGYQRIYNASYMPSWERVFRIDSSGGIGQFFEIAQSRANYTSKIQSGNKFCVTGGELYDFLKEKGLI